MGFCFDKHNIKYKNLSFFIRNSDSEEDKLLNLSEL